MFKVAQIPDGIRNVPSQLIVIQIPKNYNSNYAKFNWAISPNVLGMDSFRLLKLKSLDINMFIIQIRHIYKTTDRIRNRTIQQVETQITKY